MKIHRIYGKGMKSVKVSEELAHELRDLGVITFTGSMRVRVKGTSRIIPVYKYRRSTNEEYMARPIPDMGA